VNITVHHEIPVQSILIIASFIGAVALVARLLLRWLDTYLDRQVAKMELALDDEDNARVDAYYRGFANDRLGDPRINTVRNGSTPEKK
jgi:hypothetical protein